MSDLKSDPYAVFRPRVGRFVAIGAAVATVVVFVTLALWIPGGGVTGYTWLDRITIGAFGVGVAVFLLRYAQIKAVPSKKGLVVRNLFITRELEWSQVMGVQFGGGVPWLTLDLTDTEQLAVMAVQRADGAMAEEEAARMAALVEAHSFSATDN